MEFLLVMIGLGCILWLISKALISVGRTLEALSKKMEDRALSAEHLRYNQEKATKRAIKTLNKLQTMREEEIFQSRIKKEIEEITN